MLLKTTLYTTDDHAQEDAWVAGCRKPTWSLCRISLSWKSSIASQTFVRIEGLRNNKSLKPEWM